MHSGAINLANTTEPSMCGGDVAFFVKLLLTTCCKTNDVVNLRALKMHEAKMQDVRCKTLKCRTGNVGRKSRPVMLTLKSPA